MLARNLQKMTNRRRNLNDVQMRKIRSHSAHISSARNPKKNRMRLPLQEGDARKGPAGGCETGPGFEENGLDVVLVLGATAF